MNINWIASSALRPPRNDGIRATTQFLQEQIMRTQTDNLEYDSDFDNKEINSNHNIPCSLFYTPLIGGVVVYACMWIFKISDFHLFDTSTE